MLCEEARVQAERVRSAATQQRVLVIDDDLEQTDVLAHRLKRNGFSIWTAHTGRDGLADARRLLPDLIILDLRLPDQDGMQLCQLLSDDPATCQIPIIVVSGVDRPGIVPACRRAGCHFFVHKPYDPNALLLLVRSAIRYSRQW